MTDLQNWKNSSPLCDPARHFLFLRRESDRPVHSSSVRNSNLCGYALSRDVFIAPTSVPATVEFQQIKTQCGNLLAQQIALAIAKRYSVCSCKRSLRDQTSFFRLKIIYIYGFQWFYIKWILKFMQIFLSSSSKVKKYFSWLRLLSSIYQNLESWHLKLQSY